jgi:hypothetical protein
VDITRESGRLTSPIAGTVLPLKRAEELILTLPSVVSARIVAGDTGAVSEIHVLTNGEIPSKQMVRNIESALIAHFGMRVDHRKISVAVTQEQRMQTPIREQVFVESAPQPTPSAAVPAVDLQPMPRRTPRKLYFDDLEVQASRSRGVVCKVTLRKGEQVHVGEATGYEGERTRLELAARATLAAIHESEGGTRQMALEGVKFFEAFDRSYVFVGVRVRSGRDTHHFTGSCEVRDGVESASVLAVLDATNRLLDAS